jgi:hypothetical protein
MPDKQYRPILHLDRLPNGFDVVSSELKGQFEATTENPFARRSGMSLAQQPALANAP